MRRKLPKTILVILIFAFFWQQVGKTQPDIFYSLRPKAAEEREEKIRPFEDSNVITRAQVIEFFLLPILQSGEKTDQFIEELRSGRYSLDVMPLLVAMIWSIKKDFEGTITQVDRVAAVVDEMVKEKSELSSSEEVKAAFKQFYTVCTAMMMHTSLKSFIGDIEGVAESLGQSEQARKRKNIVAGLTTGIERKHFLLRKYKRWIEKEAFGLRELGLLLNYNLIQPWDCISIQVYIFKREFQDVIEMARSNLIKAAVLLKERLGERVPKTKESVISAIISLGILFHMKENNLEEFQIETLDNVLGEWGVAFIPKEDLEFLAASSTGELRREAWRIDEDIKNRELNQQRFIAADAAMSFGTVGALAYAIDELNKVYHEVYSEPVAPKSIRAAVLQIHIHNLCYEIFERRHDPIQEWPPNISLTEARRIFRRPDAHLPGLNRIAGEIKHISGEWHKVEVDKMRLWLHRLREIRRWERPSLERPMLGILYLGIIRTALATNEVEFAKELAMLGKAERTAIFSYIAGNTGGFAAFSKRNARGCLNALIEHTLSRNEEAFAKVLEFMNDPENAFYDEHSPPFNPNLNFVGELSKFKGTKIKGVKGIITVTPPPVEEIPNQRKYEKALSSI